MSKTITSPVKRWPGTVVISDPLTFPQVFALEDAIGNTRAEDNLTFTRADGLILPGILACVEEWHLERFPDKPTIDSFPATPRKASAELVAWLLGELMVLYKDSEEIPNA